MKRIAWIAVALMLALPVTAEELVVRTVLNEQPLNGEEGRVVVVSRLVIKPGGRIPLHIHPGDEHAVIVSGGLALMPNGKEVNFPPMAPIFFPAGSVHGGVTNQGEDDIEILTMHIVRTAAPFSTLAE